MMLASIQTKNVGQNAFSAIFGALKYTQTNVVQELV